MKKAKGLTKRIAAMVLSGMLVVGAVPGIVLASESQADIGQTSEIAAEVFEEADTEEVSADAYSEDAVVQEEEAEAQYYTVTLDANGGDFENEWDDALGENVEQAEVVEKHIPVDGTVATFPVFTDPDGRSMVFAGWSLERDGEIVAQAGEEYAPVDNCVLYAVWHEDESMNSADAEDASQGHADDQYVENAENNNEQIDSDLESLDSETVEEVEAESGETGIVAEDEFESEDTEKAIEADSAQEYEDINATEESNTKSEFEKIETVDELEKSNVEKSVIDDDYLALEAENEQTSVPVDQEAVYSDEEEQVVDENLSDPVFLEKKTQSGLIESSDKEEETAREDASMGTVASGKCGDNLTWTLDGNGIFTVSGTGEMYNYYVFNSLNSIVPTERSSQRLPDFFSDGSYKNIKQIIINEGVTSIGDGAFSYAGVSDIQNQDGYFTSISLPKSLKSIGCRSFWGTGCDEIIIDTGASITIDTNAFDASRFKKMTLAGIEKTPRITPAIQQVILKKGVTTISQGTFNGCSDLSTVSLPDGITSINKDAFSGCTSLKTITLPRTLKEIGQYAFEECGLENILIPDSVKVIYNEAFRNCKNLKSFTLSSALTSINPGLFLGCSSLESVVIPEGITVIGADAFFGCEKLTSVSLPTTLTTIYSRAFAKCYGLKQITIPANVSTMSLGVGGKLQEYSPFYRANNLTTINVANGNNTYKSYDGCLYNRNLSELIYCPEGKKSITIAPSTTSINQFAFVTAKYVGSSEEDPKLKSIYFNTCSPSFPETTFPCITATAYYNNFLGNWPSDKRQNYGGTITWVEKPLNLSECTMTISPTSYTYDGTAKKPTVTIKYNGTNLTNNTDYTVSYSNNTNAETGTVTAIGKEHFTGQISKTFTIGKASPTLSFASSSVSKKTTDSSFTNTLTKKTDGTVTFSSSNTSVATVNSSSGLVTIKGVGKTTITANAAAGTNYNAGSASYSLTVSARSISDCTMTISPTSYTYDGTAKKPTVTIKNNSTNLTINTDYTVSYNNNTNAGTGTVTATGKGSYSGTLSKTFTIGKASPTLSFASSSVSKNTTDSAFTNTLTKKTDGTVTFSSSNTSVATVNSSSGLVTIKGAGNTTITANAASGTNYIAGSASYTLTVTKPVTSAYQWGRDNWNFTNSRYDGFTSGQYISQINSSYVNRLKANLTNNEYRCIFDLEDGWIYDDWGGSCYGMSSLVHLAHNGYLPYANYKSGASKLYDLDLPKNNSNVSSLVTYYQMLQVKAVIQQQYRTVPTQSNRENIENIINLLTSNHTVLVGFRKDGWGGHTVIAYDLEYGSFTWNGITYQGCIKICDPNSSRKYDSSYNIYYNTNTYNWAIPHYYSDGILSTKGAIFNSICANSEDINEGGYLSGSMSENNSDFVARLDAYEISENRNIRKVRESNGNYNTVSGGSDDIVEDYSFISRGNNNKGIIGYNLYDSDSAYKVSQNSPDIIKLKMDYGNCYLEAESRAANSVIFDKKGYISIDSESADYNMAMTFNEDYPTDWFTIEVSGTGANEASLTKQNNGYLLTSDNLTNIQVDANNREEDVHVYASTLEQEVFICETDGMLDVRADLDHNGTFETSVSGKADLSKAVVTSLASETYNGSPLTPLPEVKMNGWVLKQGTDYTVNYKNNINAGTATVVITGTGNYEGVITESFTINKAIQSIKASDMTLTFLKTATITASGNKGKLTYKSDNTSVATVDTTGKVTAKGVGTTTISITAAATSNYNAAMKAIAVKVSKADQSITAKAAASPIAVSKTTTVSISGAKGAKSFKSSDTTIATVSSTGKVTAKKVGKVTITATSAATANYKAASKTVTIKVVPAATTSFTAANQATGIMLTWKKVAGANAYFIYRGSTQIAAIKNGSTVTYMDKKATSNGTKYTYKIIASASATGRSTLSKSVTTYCMARPAISTLTNSAASKMTVKWGKNAKATGYQIQYCPDKTFKTGNKSVSINSASTVSKVIGSLAKGKTYYVRIRTFKTVGSEKYFSAWSSVKSVKISK